MADSDMMDARQRQQQQQAEQSRAAARPWARLGMIVVLAAVVGGSLYYWQATRNDVSTDDAFIDGRAVSIAPHVTGYVTALEVNDNQFVHKGDPILRIDSRDYEAALTQAQGQLDVARGQMAGAQRALEIARVSFPAKLAQAQAQLAQAEATLTNAKADDLRQRSLSNAATTQQQKDAAHATYLAAQAQVDAAQAVVAQARPVTPNIGEVDAQVHQLSGTLEQAEAAVRQAQLNLGWCVVRAPQDGWITKRNVEIGDYAQPGAQVAALVSPDIWITANFKEAQLARMRPGQPVSITIDAYPQLKLRGHVDSIQLGTGAKFTAFPAENATGNFVKIVERVPVKIIIDSGLDNSQPLPLGLSAEPVVDVK